MKPAIIHVNSYPGVGKLTISRILADKLDAKLLDNHSIYNVAFALNELKSEEFYQTVRNVRLIAYDLIETLPNSVPVVLTNAHTKDSPWGNECWNEAVDLAKRTSRSHIVVLLDCSREENARRIQSPGREAKRKLRDPKVFRQGDIDSDLIDISADYLLRFDITDLSAEAAANHIQEWLVREKLADHT